MKNVVVLCISAGILLLSCKSYTQKNTTEEKSKTMHEELAPLDGAYEIILVKTQNAPEGVNLFFEPKENTYYGKSSCNQYRGSFTSDQLNINFNHSMGTKMYCEGKMEFENMYFKTLSEITRYNYISNEEFVGMHFFNQNDEVIIKARRIYYGH